MASFPYSKASSTVSSALTVGLTSEYFNSNELSPTETFITLSPIKESSWVLIKSIASSFVLPPKSIP